MKTLNTILYSIIKSCACNKKLFILIVVLSFAWQALYSQENTSQRNINQTNTRDNEFLLPLGARRPQSGVWTEIRPNVPRVDYWGVYFINTDTGFACGVNGAIIKTTNSGDSWTTLNSGTTKTLKTIGSYDGSLIIAAGDSGIIISSTDLGETWRIINNSSNQNIWNMQMLTPRVGWLVGEGSTALKTTDGGNSWLNQPTPLTGFAYWDVSFLDTLFGYISCDGGRILRTSDNGISWDVKQAGDNYGLFTIEAVTRTSAVALGFAGKHVYTSDGGANWNFITFLGGSEPNNIDFIDTLHGFAVGFGGCYETTNSGRNWTWRSDMVDGASIVFPANNTAYYVGKYLTIRKTTDTGLIWKKCVINDDFIDVFFTDENSGWLIGQELYKSILYKTYDGGITLTQVEDFPGINPSALYFTSNQTGIVGARNKIFKTTDAGINWQQVIINGYDSLFIGGEFKRMFFLTDEIGWAINSGSVVKTTNGGDDWSVQLYAEILAGIHFSDTRNGWVARSGGGIAQPFRSSDGGINWIEQSSLTFNTTSDVYFRDSLNGFITSSNTLYRTYNRGLNWQLVTNGSRFSNIINNNIFLLGVQVRQSTDSGDNWIVIPELSNRELSFIRLNVINKGYAIGSRGLVIKYYDEDLPVELISFNAEKGNENKTILKWSTATETNNLGFTIERLKIIRSNEQVWEDVGFINGAGTTTETKTYSFVDENLNPGKYKYRLKQIDFDGSFEYSKIVEIEIQLPDKFKLNQNYPNPFNPKTKIEFQLPQSTNVKLTVFNILGEKVTEILNEELEAGFYSFYFDGKYHSSGVYIYQIKTPGFTQARKMILTK